jgi:hypothetical protein
MFIFSFIETLRKPYFDFLEKHPKIKITQIVLTFFVSGWTFKNTSHKLFEIIIKALQTKKK